MSKIYTQYEKLKKENSEKILLFKGGIFYIFIADDAIKMSEELNLKITNLNETVVKCGFPTSRLKHYIDILKEKNIDFEIVDENYTKVENYSDYLNNEKIKDTIKKILDIDFDNTTYKDAFEFLLEIQTDLKKIL